jgi:hypothetical protein
MEDPKIRDIISQLNRIDTTPGSGSNKTIQSLIEKFRKNSSLIPKIKGIYARGDGPGGGAGRLNYSPTLRNIEKIIGTSAAAPKAFAAPYSSVTASYGAPSYGATTASYRAPSYGAPRSKLSTINMIYKNTRRGKAMNFNNESTARNAAAASASAPKNIPDAVAAAADVFIDYMNYMDDTGIYDIDTRSINENMANENMANKRKIGGSDVVEENESKTIQCAHSTLINSDYLGIILKIMDTYHDFWGGAGESPISNETKTALLRITVELKRLLTIAAAEYISTFDPANIYTNNNPHGFINFNDIGGEIIGRLTSLHPPDITDNSLTNIRNLKAFREQIKNITQDFLDQILQKPTDNASPLRDKKIISMSESEKSTAYGTMCIPNPMKFIKRVTNKNPAKYLYLIQNIFTVPPVVGADGNINEDIYIICDAGGGAMGKLGSFNGSRLKQIITQCTIADSANTEKVVYGDTSLTENERSRYMFVSNRDGDRFESDSNLYTKVNGYNIFYECEQNGTGVCRFEMNDCYNFSLQIEMPADNVFRFNFGSNMTQGPSAALLSGYFFKASHMQDRTIDDPTFINNIVTQINEKLSTRDSALRFNYIDTNGNIHDLSEFNGIDPRLFLDIKRGGDRDQVMTAKYLTDLYPGMRIIFCTGDLLCATIAVRLGLPTIYQTKDGILRYWKENSMTPSNENTRTAARLLEVAENNSNTGSSATAAAAAGLVGIGSRRVVPNNEIMHPRGGGSPLLGGGEDGDIGDSISYVDIIHFIQNIAAHSAFSLRSNISRGATYAYLDSTVKTIKNLIKNYYEPWEDFMKSLTSEPQQNIYKYVYGLFFNPVIENANKIKMFALLHDVINNNTTSANISNIYTIIPDNQKRIFNSYCDKYKDLIKQPFNGDTIDMYKELLNQLHIFVFTPAALAPNSAVGRKTQYKKSQNIIHNVSKKQQRNLTIKAIQRRVNPNKKTGPKGRISTRRNRKPEKRLNSTRRNTKPERGLFSNIINMATSSNTP